MTEVYRGCQVAGCNAPEGECGGGCMRRAEVPGLFTTAPPAERDDSPLLCEILGFLSDLTHPEQYGYAVPREVRKRARELAAAIETAEGML